MAGSKVNWPLEAPVLCRGNGDFVAVRLINAKYETLGRFDNGYVQLFWIRILVPHKRAAQPVIRIGAMVLDFIAGNAHRASLAGMRGVGSFPPALKPLIRRLSEPAIRNRIP